MAQIKKVEDLMVDIFDFPHIPYWFTIRQAIGIIKASAADGTKHPEPLTLLVFDEKYCLLGTVGLKDLLQGIGTGFPQTTAMPNVAGNDEPGPAAPWEALFSGESRVKAERPVREIMNPARFSVDPEAPAAKAAYLMIQNDLALLPVLEGAKKFVGLVRLADLFDVMTSVVMED